MLRWIGLAVSLGASAPPTPLAVVSPAAAAPTATPSPSPGEPARVLGPERCGECHTAELLVLEKSHHGRSFTTLAGSPRAREIAAKLGVERVKKDPACARCHFTIAEVDGKSTAVAAVACESCHGPGRDWIETHYDFGENGAKAEDETAPHRAARHARTAALGMNRPADLDRLARRCFACHSVPDPELIDRSDHPTASAFELVAWTQGEVRHNYFFSSDHKNRSASPARRRLLFTLGRALDLETSLRAAALATAEGRYLAGATLRTAGALARLRELAGVLKLPEIDAMLAAAGDGSVALARRSELSAAADTIAAATHKLVEAHDGSRLTGVDRLLPAADGYRGRALQ